jgi:hypothetical protein
MNFSELLEALNQASGFELYRLRVAIDRALTDPKWTIAIRAQLHVGQEIEYFDPRANRLCPGQILEFRTKEVLVRQTDTQQLWWLAYPAINVNHVDVSVRETSQQGLSRNEVAIGDTVGFVDHEQRQRSGKVMRLNDKTVTLHCEGQKWRVAYALLHRVLNQDSSTTINASITKA